jgi:hypothetical protein
MKIDARSMRELWRKQVRTRTSFHRQVALPFSCEKGALRVRAAWMGGLSATFWRAWKEEGKNWKVKMDAYCRGCHAPLARGWMLHAADWRGV